MPVKGLSVQPCLPTLSPAWVETGQDTFEPFPGHWEMILFLQGGPRGRWGGRLLLGP
jgi:hypothetical protein